MSKKDFIALADALKAARPTAKSAISQWGLDCVAIADACARANPAFKRDRWLDYVTGTVGPNGGKPKA